MSRNGGAARRSRARSGLGTGDSRLASFSRAPSAPLLSIIPSEVMFIQKPNAGTDDEYCHSHTKEYTQQVPTGDHLAKRISLVAKK
jgi:hypothetical protein